MSLTQINKAGLDEIALDHVFTIGASGSSAYTFQGEGLNGTVNNPTLYLTRGKTYRFENGTGAHAIRIQSADNGTNGTLYNTGVTNNNTTGTVIVEVQHDAPDVLYYQCAVHASMKGTLYITGALPDGGVTTAKLADDAVTQPKIAASAIHTENINDNAVTTAKITDSNITTAKIANNAVTTPKILDSAVSEAKLGSSVVTTAKLAAGAVTEAKLATNAVTTDKINSGVITNAKLAANAVGTANIADEAVTLAKLPHGTSSNDGKFLRANNGADPSFESVPAGITVNNQAANRVITATGTSNTLTGESQFTYDGKALIEAGTAELEVKGSVQGRVIYTDSAATSGKRSYDITSNSDRLKVRSLNDNFTSATDAITVEGNSGIVTLASNPYWIGYKSGEFTSSSGWNTISIDTTRFEAGGTNWSTSNYEYTVPDNHEL